MSIAEYIAQEFRAEMARRRPRLTGRQLAAHMGKPASTVARWLNGEALGFDEAYMIGRALDVNVTDLWNEACAIRDLNPEPADSTHIVQDHLWLAA